MNLEKRYSRLPDIEHSTFRAMFDDVCAKYADLCAARMTQGENPSYTEWTYADLKREAYSAGAFLYARGLRQGERVALISENRPEWCFAYIAVLAAGFVAIPIDAGVDAASVADILNLSHAKAIIYSHAHSSKIDASLSADDARIRIAFDGDSGAFSWKEAASYAASSDTLPALDSNAGAALAVIIYTSGTTGVAKGIMLSQRGILANVNAAVQSLNVSSADRFIAVLPLHHTYAATCTFLAPLAVGASITFVEKMVPSVILKHIERSRITFMIGVPLLFDKIKQGMQGEIQKLSLAPRTVVRSLMGLCAFCSGVFRLPAGKVLLGFLRGKAGLRTVRLGVAGGGPLSWDSARFFETIGFNLVQGYGMSENGPLIAVNLPECKNNRSVGFAVKHTRVRIAEPNQSGIGEIQVHSPSLMLGYLDNAEATRAVMTEDGWLRTGDLGFIDKRGFIFITGRSKNIIVTTGGKNVYPEEIELKFEGLEWIKEVLVLGRRMLDTHSGEEVIAVCVPDWEKTDAACGSEDRAAFAREKVRLSVQAVNKQLQPFMKISDFIIRETEFEKTSTRKIRRFLYNEYAEPVNKSAQDVRE